MAARLSARRTEIVVHCGGNSKDFLFARITKTAPGVGKF